MDIEIKTDYKEFHGRSCGIIKQENKFLIMRLDKAPYFHIQWQERRETIGI